MRYEITGDDLVFEGRRYKRIDFELFREARGDELGLGGNGIPEVEGQVGIARVADGGNEGVGVDFFGTRATGHYFCFVVDISGSMEGAKIAALKKEILQTLDKIPDDASFQVVFFNHTAMTLSNDWTRATTANIRRFERQLGRVLAEGGTVPAEAIRYALTLLTPKPDCTLLSH